MKKIILSCLLIFGFSNLILGQLFSTFLRPSDTLNQKRLHFLYVSEATAISGTLLGLNQLWYADYPKSSFHFINDNADWLQMDKMGHIYSSYQLGKFGANALKWTGTSQKNQLIYGATLGWVFMTTVEAFDGFSSQWGASSGDLIANSIGTSLYISQELLWNEQRIQPKFSFHYSQYAAQRPSVLGKTASEQILKDYNGQTYWFSINIHSFIKKSKIPKWANLALGYGADGMLYGSENVVENKIYPSRYRQFYLSLDINLTKIKTKSPFLKTIFFVCNSIKIPAPALEISPASGLQFHYFYF